MVEYQWEKIYTLNIDDFLENLYSERGKALNVWNNDHDDRTNSKSKTLLVKLHGCVNNAKGGYVFDDDEYMSFLNEETCFLKSFGDSFVTGDMIFLGTEFQESDLKTIINRYESDGYDTKGNNYFFITPKIGDATLRRKIAETENYYWISWTTEDFLSFLHGEISSEKDVKKLLDERGMKWIDQLQREMNLHYESELYMGRESQYNDFFHSWDIPRPGMEEFEDKIVSHKKSLVAAVIGKSYVGKTCFAKRVLIDLKNRGYFACQFNMRSSEHMHLFLEYLKQLPEGTRLAVLFEDASFYYNMIYRVLLLKCPKNIAQLAVITSEKMDNHYSKEDVLKTNGCLEVFKLTENISWRCAENIYDKLKEKGWLNRPTVHGEDPGSIKKYACQTNDIIEFLYNITNGRGYEEHYSDLISQKSNEVELKYLRVLALLGTLGISAIPDRIFPVLLKKDKNKFHFNKFRKSFDEILMIEEHRIKLRCLRLVENVLVSEMRKEETCDILMEVVKQASGRFSENEMNEWYEIFQKVLSVKTLLKENILPLETVRELLNTVEKQGEKYSYYWIQRGIVAEKGKAYDLADNYFRKAIAINPVSYQANHALAKNLMERAISAVECGEISYASHYMEEGKNEIKKIMGNPAFSRGYKYSIHAYIDMLLKYLNVTGTEMSDDDIAFIQTSIVEMDKNSADTCVKEAIGTFMDYIYKYKPEKKENDAVRAYYGELVQAKYASEQAYSIENLDFE